MHYVCLSVKCNLVESNRGTCVGKGIYVVVCFFFWFNFFKTNLNFSNWVEFFKPDRNFQTCLFSFVN